MNDMQDYEIRINTPHYSMFRTVKGYPSYRAALNVVVTELNSWGGVFSNDGDLFISERRITSLEVIDVRD